MPKKKVNNHKKTIIIIFLVLVLILALMQIGINPHQDKINLVSKQIIKSKACAVVSEGYCIKYEKIRMSNWEVKEYREGHIINALSVDIHSSTGSRLGNPIWYIEENKVFWINGAAKQISSILVGEASNDIQQDILGLNKQQEDISLESKNDICKGIEIYSGVHSENEIDISIDAKQFIELTNGSWEINDSQLQEVIDYCINRWDEKIPGSNNIIVTEQEEKAGVSDEDVIAWCNDGCRLMANAEGWNTYEYNICVNSCLIG